MFGKAKQVKPFRPQANTNSIFDIMSGRYEKGCKGEWILNGGVANIDGFSGPGNSMKTTLALFRMLSVLTLYPQAKAFFYDTEASASLRRFEDLANTIDPTGQVAESLKEEHERLSFTSIEYYNGTEWFDILRAHLADRLKNEKELETPFLDVKNNVPYKLYAPLVGGVDSLSVFQTGSTTKSMDKGSPGESDLNSLSMTNNNGKDQFMMMLPGLMGKTNTSIFLTAHMGAQIIMDKYNAPKKKLWTIGGDKKMKKVPESYTFLTNNLYEVTGLSPLLNKGDKKPEFPISKEEDIEGNTDLMELTLLPVRTKYGITGIPMKLVMSQKHGFQSALTNYWFCKCFDRYGLSDNAVNQRLDLMPDLVFTRITIRNVVKENTMFVRALQITMELCYMKWYWQDFARTELPTVKELYEGLIAKGYDWNELLNTRGYWTYDQYGHEKHYMSTRDLLDYYHDRKKPYWK